MNLFANKKDLVENKQNEHIKMAIQNNNPSDSNFQQDQMQNQNMNFDNNNYNNNLEKNQNMQNMNFDGRNNNSQDNQNNFNNPFANNSESMNNQNINPFEEMQTQTKNETYKNPILENQSPQSSILDNVTQNQTNLDKYEIQEIIDETVEKVIEERWSKLVNNVEKVVKWKDKQEAQINTLKEDILSIKEAYEILEKKILNKINSYDTNILDVNSEIKALEKVFQKITPSLINNVNELGRITQELKNLKENTDKVSKDLSGKNIESS